MSMSALLRAVRDQIRTHASYSTQHCNVEIDERAPAVVPDVYIIVFGGGTTAGPTNPTNPGAYDRLFAVNVSVALRSTKKPRDRSRDLAIATTDSLEVHFRNIDGKVDFQYDVNTAANAFILAETGSSEGFIEPLVFQSKGPIRVAPAEIFGGFGDELAAAVIQTATYGNARRIKSR